MYKKKYQMKNPKTGAWVVYGVMASGKTKILNVKQKAPSVKFKGIPVKR